MDSCMIPNMLTCSLQSGSNGNAIYVEAGGVRLLFDAGISGRCAQQRLAGHGREIRDVDALIISHDHVDHIRCAGVYQRLFGFPVYMTRWTHAATWCKLGKLNDLRYFESGDTLAFTTGKWHHGSKMIIDATSGGEGADGSRNGAVALPADLRAIAPAVRKHRLVGQTMLAVQVDRGDDARGVVEALVRSGLLSSVKIVAVVSDDVDLDDDVDLIWGIFTRFDPAQDVVFTEMTMRGAVTVYSGVMAATPSSTAFCTA